MKNIKKFLPGLSAVFVMSLTSCAGSSSWNECGTSYEVNYCLLQGQMDHNDSIERTRGTRDALGTRANDDDNLNENVQQPKVNESFTVSSETKGDVNVKVREIEHATMVSTAGATWDSITANDTATIWLNKHSADKWTDLNGNTKRGQSITMFVSNNDGMSMGAIGSVMWPKGMPIFGFDANDASLIAIRDGKMTGTIDPNPICQVAACLMIVRNISDWDESNGLSRFDNSVAFANVLRGPSGEHDPYYDKPFGYINPQNLQEQKEIKGVNPRALLSQGVRVTRNRYPYNEETQSDLQRLKTYFNDDGTVKNATDRIYDAEPYLNENPTPKGTRKLFMTYNNQTDTFMSTTIRPLFNKLKGKFGVDIDDFSGNGNDEAGCLDAFGAAVNKEGYDAFIINMVKSSNGYEYIKRLKESKIYYKDGKITVPVIFWNKQPTDVDGNVDTEIMHDPVFNFVCYVGIDSYNSGQAQGRMVQSWVYDQYSGNKY